MSDLISRSALIADIDEAVVFSGRPNAKGERAGAAKIIDRISLAPAVDAVVLPCKIGNRVWAIRNFKGVKQPQDGIVSEMFFTNDMKLQIVVKYVARGEWGKTIFATRGDAEKALAERKE